MFRNMYKSHLINERILYAVNRNLICLDQVVESSYEGHQRFHSSYIVRTVNFPDHIKTGQCTTTTTAMKRRVVKFFLETFNAAAYEEILETILLKRVRNQFYDTTELIHISR